MDGSFRKMAHEAQGPPSIPAKRTGFKRHKKRDPPGTEPGRVGVTGAGGTGGGSADQTLKSVSTAVPLVFRVRLGKSVPSLIGRRGVEKGSIGLHGRCGRLTQIGTN